MYIRHIRDIGVSVSACIHDILMCICVFLHEYICFLSSSGPTVGNRKVCYDAEVYSVFFTLVVTLQPGRLCFMRKL